MVNRLTLSKFRSDGIRTTEKCKSFNYQQSIWPPDNCNAPLIPTPSMRAVFSPSLFFHQNMSKYYLRSECEHSSLQLTHWPLVPRKNHRVRHVATSTMVTIAQPSCAHCLSSKCTFSPRSNCTIWAKSLVAKYKWKEFLCTLYILMCVSFWSWKVSETVHDQISVSSILHQSPWRSGFLSKETLGSHRRARESAIGESATRTSGCKSHEREAAIRENGTTICKMETPTGPGPKQSHNRCGSFFSVIAWNLCTDDEWGEQLRLTSKFHWVRDSDEKNQLFRIGAGCLNVFWSSR